MRDKFAVFASSYYYPSGGWKDFKFCLDDESAAATVAKVLVEKEDYDWAQVVNLDDARLVVSFETSYERPDRMKPAVRVVKETR